jgi:Holliday junction resolvase-like predicted endonuclease
MPRDEGRMAEMVVLDDNGDFVEAVVARLIEQGIPATGYKSVEAFGRDARSGKLRDAALMFFDMNLGPRRGGGILTASDVIPVAKTYAPAAKILIFTYQGISLEDCIHCVRLGALGLIPKSHSLDELLLAAQVYPYIGDSERATEAVIQELWERLQRARERDKGQLFEMLVANLLSTVEGLSFIGNNWNKPSGEIDLIFENNVDIRFWTELKSFHIIVECKNRKDPSETSDFSTFVQKVRSKGGCRVGIMASWVKVSRGFRILQQTSSDGEAIFILDRDDLAELIPMKKVDRTRRLTELFSKQM